MVNLFLLIPSPREVGVISPCRIVGIEERTIVVPNKNRSTKGLKDRINKYTCLTTSYARLKNNLAPIVYLIDFHCIALFRAIDFRNLWRLCCKHAHCVWLNSTSQHFSLPMLWIHIHHWPTYHCSSKFCPVYFSLPCISCRENLLMKLSLR